MSGITIILLAQAAYAAAGLAFALAFVFLGVGQVDPAARHVSTGFRLLIIPGVAALWPLMMRRWLAARRRST